MIKKLANAIAQDFLLTFRSGHIYVILAMAAIILILVFALPAQVNVQSAEYFFDEGGSGPFTAFLLQSGVPQESIVQSGSELNDLLAENQKAIGIIFNGDLQSPDFKIIVQGDIPKENINLLEASLDMFIKMLQGSYTPVEAKVTTLMPGTEPIPLNKNMIPIFMTFEVILLGFLIGAVLIFQGKQEGSLRAYRVSPGGTLVFILSKVILYAVLSLVYGLSVSLIAFGFSFNYFHLSILIVLSSALMTLLGLAIAVFFTNISEWFFAGALLLVVAMLPTLSYAIPMFSPRFITWIPTYRIIFGFRDILFGIGSQSNLNQTYLIGVVALIISFVFCYVLVDKKLMKAGR